MKTISDLAQECAQLAWENRTITHDGKVLCSSIPLPGDWEALEEFLGRRPNSEEFVDFESSYTIARLTGDDNA